MGRRSISGGVRAAGPDRIEFTFTYQGKRYRPTLLRTPTEKNLLRARQQLADIKSKIRHKVFNFEEEFPEYRFAGSLPGESTNAAQEIVSAPKPLKIPEPTKKPVVSPQRAERLCKQVFDEFLSHCDMRVRTGDMAFSSLNSYRKILKRCWRPKLDKREFLSVVYSELLAIAAEQGWKTKKTYNNGVSPLRCAFEFGYKDNPEKPNPEAGLDCLRITKKDRPKIDPFSIQEAERLIVGIHAEWGEATGNFDEFRFFTGLRQSEQIALREADCDVQKGTIRVHQVVVLHRNKDRPKNNEERTVDLCPRALAVLKRQLALRERLIQAGTLDHDLLFFKADGGSIRNLKYPYGRWCCVVDKLGMRYRTPYNARHSCVSWNLMTGKNPLWCSEQFGHSVQVMFERYGKWIEGASEADIEAIKASVAAEATASRLEHLGFAAPLRTLQSPEFASRNWLGTPQLEKS